MHRRSDAPLAQWADIAVLLVAWLIVLAAFAAAAHCEAALPTLQNGEPERSTGLPSPGQGELGGSDTPSLEAVDKYGYVIEQIARARYPSATIVEGFEGTVWVRYTESRPEWRFTLTFRPKRAEALRDCEAWMDRVERALKKNSKHGR